MTDWYHKMTLAQLKGRKVRAKHKVRHSSLLMVVAAILAARTHNEWLVLILGVLVFISTFLLSQIRKSSGPRP